jgi:hypothetical protein
MQPSDSLVPISRRSSHPSPTAYLGAGACSSPHARAPASVPSVGDGSPALRITGFSPRRDKGLPGSWAVLFVCAVVEDPAGCRPPLAHVGEVAVAFRWNKTLGTRNEIAFVAAWPTAHTFACLRIAGRVATPVARLATDPGGLTPGRAGFAPAGRQTKFHEVIAYSTPLRPACPGRTVPTILALQSSAICRVVHDGHTPLVEQENASKKSCPHALHLARPKPQHNSPQSR